MKLLLAGLEQFDVAGGVNGVAEVGVLPLRQVELFGGSSLHLLRHQSRAFQLRHLMKGKRDHSSSTWHFLALFAHPTPFATCDMFNSALWKTFRLWIVWHELEIKCLLKSIISLSIMTFLSISNQIIVFFAFKSTWIEWRIFNCCYMILGDIQIMFDMFDILEGPERVDNFFNVKIKCHTQGLGMERVIQFI